MQPTEVASGPMGPGRHSPISEHSLRTFLTSVAVFVTFEIINATRRTQ